MCRTSSVDPRTALRAQAQRLLEAGAIAPAIEAHARLLSADPGDGDAWFNLGWLQQQARRFPAALGAYRQALAHHVAAPADVHVAIAVVLAQALERPEEAEQALADALALDPRHLGAWVNLGNLREQRGHRGTARAAYEAALAVDPDHPLVLSRLAGVSDVRRADDALLGRLREALALPSRRDDEAADLGFALAQALERVGAHEEAFSVCEQANRRSRAAFGGVRYDAVAQAQQVDRLIAAWPERPVGLPGADGTPDPVFICGLFRSGSTLVEQVLAAHPQVAAGGEIDVLPIAARALCPPPPAPFTMPAPEELQALRDAYLERTAAARRRAPVVTDKRPDNFLHLGLVKTLFPRARIVHTRRDPLDNCLSIWFHHLGPAMPYALDLEDTAHWARQHDRLMAHWRRVFGDDILTVDYDAFVVDPKPTLAALLAHCGLPWEEGCLAFHRRAGDVRTPSNWQVREPLYRHASGRWRRHAARLQPLRTALGR